MQSNGRKMEFQDKIATAVYMAILDVKTETKEEEIRKKEYMDKINKFICNYDDLKPILDEHFEKKSVTR